MLILPSTLLLKADGGLLVRAIPLYLHEEKISCVTRPIIADVAGIEENTKLLLSDYSVKTQIHFKAGFEFENHKVIAAFDALLPEEIGIKLQANGVPMALFSVVPMEVGQPKAIAVHVPNRDIAIIENWESDDNSSGNPGFRAFRATQRQSIVSFLGPSGLIVNGNGYPKVLVYGTAEPLKAAANAALKGTNASPPWISNLASGRAPHNRPK